jgi:hypothetical protein
MDLEPFPFDTDDVEFEVRGSECFLKNGETNANFKTDYRWLLTGKHNDDRFKMGKHIAPHGWSIIATEIEYVNLSHEQDVVRIRIHMSRIWSYYMYKVLFPMFMIVIVNFAQAFFPVDDLPGKMEHITALFLSTFALLYVVAADLPKTSFQTPMDWVILFTMLVLATSGIISVICAYIAGGTDHDLEPGKFHLYQDANDSRHSVAEKENSRDSDKIEWANFINWVCVTVLTVLYFLTVAGMFLPNYIAMRRSNASLRAKTDKSNLILVGVDEHVTNIKADPHRFMMPDTLYKPW